MVKRYAPQILLYAFSIALLVWVLKYLEFRYMMRDLETEIYLSVVAILFTALGLAIGRKLIPRSQSTINGNQLTDPEKLRGKYAITQREWEVLQLVNAGFSNKQIADELHLSIHTVKSHLSRIFEKLAVSRRTEALHRAREIGLIKETSPTKV